VETINISIFEARHPGRDSRQAFPAWRPSG